MNALLYKPPGSPAQPQWRFSRRHVSGINRRHFPVRHVASPALACFQRVCQNEGRCPSCTCSSSVRSGHLTSWSVWLRCHLVEDCLSEWPQRWWVLLSFAADGVEARALVSGLSFPRPLQPQPQPCSSEWTPHAPSIALLFCVSFEDFIATNV